MPKVRQHLNKTNQNKVNHFIKKTANLFENAESFSTDIQELITVECRNLRDCHEPHVVKEYISFIKKYVSNLESTDELLVWNHDDINNYIKPAVRVILAHRYTSRSYDNSIDIYFNDVKREYILNPMSETKDLEFSKENRDIFIKNNLKLVINCAKRYRGLGLDFDDLIQAGNLGLLIAIDKFDPARGKLKNAVLKNIDAFEKDIFTYDDSVNIINNSFEYDKDATLTNTLKLLPLDGFSSHSEFKQWVNKNIKSAVFASVAFQWIRATILNELAKTPQIVRVPKSQVEEGINPSKNHHMVFIDELQEQDDEININNKTKYAEFEQHLLEDEVDPDADTKQKIMQDFIYSLLEKLSFSERRIIKKLYGLNLPFPMSYQDIAISEGLTVTRVKYIVTQIMKKIKNDITEEQQKYFVSFFQK